MGITRREIVKAMAASFVCAVVFGSIAFAAEKKLWECRGCQRQHQSQRKPEPRLGGPCPKPYWSASDKHEWIEVD